MFFYFIQELFHFIEEIDFKTLETTRPATLLKRQRPTVVCTYSTYVRIQHKAQNKSSTLGSATHKNHTENQRSFQTIIEGAHHFFAWLPPKKTAGSSFFFGGVSRKFRNRDFSSVSENVFPGILGDFLSPFILTKTRCFRVHQLHLLRHVGTYIQIHISQVQTYMYDINMSTNDPMT